LKFILDSEDAESSESNSDGVKEVNDQTFEHVRRWQENVTVQCE